MFNVTVEHAILLYQGEAQPSHKKTQEIIADRLTKLLGPVAFEKFVDLLGLTSIDTAVLTAKK